MITNTAAALTPEERAAKIADNEQKLARLYDELAKTQQRLRQLSKEEALRVLKNHALGALVTPAMSPEEARETVMSYLLEAPAIPLHLGMRDVLISGGLDESHITHGELNGMTVGYVTGIQLLKFVGFLHEDAPTLQEAALLMSISDDDTKH